MTVRLRFTAKRADVLTVFGRRVELTPGAVVELTDEEWAEVRAIAAPVLRPIADEVRA